MKVSLDTGKGPRRRMVVQTPTHAVFDGPCPCCQVKPLRVAGRGKRIANNDREYHADGVCLACGGAVGTIIAAVDTVFGLEEDERVLAGPWKVY